MLAIQLKRDLLLLLERVDDQTDIEDVFKQIALLEDVYRSEKDIEEGQIFSQEEVESRMKTWK